MYSHVQLYSLHTAQRSPTERRWKQKSCGLEQGSFCPEGPLSLICANLCRLIAAVTMTTNLHLFKYLLTEWLIYWLSLPAKIDKCYILDPSHGILFFSAYMHFLTENAHATKKNSIKYGKKKACTLSSQFHPLTTEEKKHKGPLFCRLLFPMFWAKLHRNYEQLACMSDQKSTDSSMNRTSLAPMKPGCWSSGTRIRESNSIPWPWPQFTADLHLLPLAGSQSTHGALWPISAVQRSLRCYSKESKCLGQKPLSQVTLSHCWETSFYVSLLGAQASKEPLSGAVQLLFACQSLTNMTNERRKWW